MFAVLFPGVWQLQAYPGSSEAYIVGILGCLDICSVHDCWFSILVHKYFGILLDFNG